jgi:hypothetical protein
MREEGVLLPVEGERLVVELEVPLEDPRASWFG